MKKILRILHSKKKIRSNHSECKDDISKDAVPDPPRERSVNSNSSNCRDNSTNKDIFPLKNWNNGNEDGIKLRSGSCPVENSEVENTHSENSLICNFNSVPESNSDLIKKRLPDFKGQQNLVISSKNNCDSQNSSSSLSSNSSNPELDIIRHSKDIGRRKKFKDVKGNFTVLKISNSRNFHIGSTTIYNSGIPQENSPISRLSESATIREDEGNISIVVNESPKRLTLESLMENNTVISFDNLSAISSCITDWTGIGTQIGMNKTSLNLLKEKHKNNIDLLVEEMLHQFLKKYPETTVGFICFILKECKQNKALQELWNCTKVL